MPRVTTSVQPLLPTNQRILEIKADIQKEFQKILLELPWLGPHHMTPLQQRGERKSSFRCDHHIPLLPEKEEELKS